MAKSGGKKGGAEEDSSGKGGAVSSYTSSELQSSGSRNQSTGSSLLEFGAATSSI